MSLPNYLAKIKSSGIYRFVWDKSEIAGVDAEILRLVVGYSDKGPFNTPVYVKSEAEFKSIFGDISKKLEKRGAYFHRMALQCLAKGPILALNLKKFKTEQVDGAAFDVIGEEIKPIKINVENVYDITRFWKLSPEDAHKALCEKQSNYISFVATDSKDASCSIIMRGYHPTGYDVTVAKWYIAQGEDIPEYFENYTDMLISDFFAEVYVFRGKFTAALCAAEPLNRYFDIENGNPVLKEYVVNAFGEKVDTLPLLAAESASNLVNSYSGCLLPFFKGNNGSYISLDLLFNADNHLHKMMMNLDSDLLYNGTLAPTDIATTGWNNNDTIILGTTVKKTEIEYSIKNTKPVLDASGNIVVFENQLTGPESVAGAEPTCFEPNFVSYAITPKDVVKNIAGYLYFVVEEGITTKGEESKTYSKLVAVDDYAANYKELYLDAEGKLFANIGDEPINLNVVGDTKAHKFTILETATPSDEKKDLFYGYYCDNEATEGKRTVMIYENGKRIQEYLFAVADYKADELVNSKEWKFDFSTIGLKVGDRVLYTNNVYTIAEIYTDHLVAYNSLGESVEIKSDFKLCNSSCGINNKGLYPVYFEGYTLASELAKPGLDMLSKLDWQKKILSALSDIDGYPGLRLALTNRTDIDYRYIVDTFEAFVDTEVHKELALICKEKDNALGFLNFPAVKTFRDCPYTSFTDQNNRFQVKYIAEGGNRQKNPGRLFTLVSEDNGASFVSYNTPLTFTDGTVKTYVPSAAMVSNNFMEKYLSRQPYYIVAGPTYGRMIANGLVGPDFNYSRADLDILEPMGVNAMVYVPRLGTYINSNQTAKQNPKTALSSINVRELVIYLQDEIEKLMQDYQWEFNTPGLRELIKAKADVICERVKNNGGIYDFLNVCDKSNNTDDVIDNEMFVLSTSIEPGRGAGKMVQELTLYKTGGMQSIIR